MSTVPDGDGVDISLPSKYLRSMVYAIILLFPLHLLVNASNADLKSDIVWLRVWFDFGFVGFKDTFKPFGLYVSSWMYDKHQTW